MAVSFSRLATLALFCLSAAGCASTPEWGATSGNLPAPYISGTRVVTPETHTECVAYARARSGIALHGDAGTWWEKAKGVYARSSAPLLGAVMVLTGYAGPGRGHLAVVTTLLSDREIRVDHANWLNDGNIYVSDPVVDVSPDNDWTEVRVWNPATQSWGVKTYLVQGFIGPGSVAPTERLSSN
jgi:surface antigen